ncbi:YoaK family protein [Limibacter armeniacum]|uniref:YoaK family protein n=1 Tax=Limibacter armeniacum TaxID=466084 RepID=UPI002FE68BCE
MLRKYSSFRSLSDNIKLGSLTAFSAGMVNVISVIAFFAFTSNVTGHYAILAQEIAKGNWYQAAIVFVWISLFFLGNFASNLMIIHNNKQEDRYKAHALPLAVEILCLLGVGLYMQFYYSETLQETETLVAILLFAMGLQNGLTASISNSAVKTTHLTGLTTDLGILFSMFTKKEFRSDKALLDKARLLLCIMVSYMTGGIISGVIYYELNSMAFFVVCFVLCIVMFYDYYHLKVTKGKGSSAGLVHEQLTGATLEAQKGNI